MEDFSKENYVLIKTDSEFGYYVLSKPNGNFLIIENVDEARAIIQGLLNIDAEVFDNINDFRNKYPPLTAEERNEEITRLYINKITKGDKG